MKIVLPIILSLMMFGCTDLSETDKCELVTDQICQVLDRCSYQTYQDCDEHYSAEYCSQVEVNDAWESCYSDLSTMTCEDSYPPASCEKVFSEI